MQSNFRSALRAANLVGQKSESLILVREGGIEPPTALWKSAILPLNYSRSFYQVLILYPRLNKIQTHVQSTNIKPKINTAPAMRFDSETPTMA